MGTGKQAAPRVRRLLEPWYKNLTSFGWDFVYRDAVQPEELDSYDALAGAWYDYYPADHGFDPSDEEYEFWCYVFDNFGQSDPCQLTQPLFAIHESRMPKK